MKIYPISFMICFGLWEITPKRRENKNFNNKKYLVLIWDLSFEMELCEISGNIFPFQKFKNYVTKGNQSLTLLVWFAKSS